MVVEAEEVKEEEEEVDVAVEAARGIRRGSSPPRARRGRTPCQQLLPTDAGTNIVQGLSLASHIKFAKMFADYASDLKNPLLRATQRSKRSRPFYRPP